MRNAPVIYIVVPCYNEEEVLPLTAEFLGKNHFLVGVSLDGLKEIHDRYRLDAAGKGTYQRGISAIRLLEKHQVEYNILTVVTAATARNGQKIYNYFKKNWTTCKNKVCI